MLCLVVSYALLAQAATAPGTNAEQYSHQFITAVYVPSVSHVSPKNPQADYWKSVIVAYAERYGVDPGLAVRVARCESGFQPDAQNATSSASGIYQFIDSTWKSQSMKYGITGEKDDPYLQIELFSRMVADGGITHWNASKNCWQGVY